MKSNIFSKAISLVLIVGILLSLNCSVVFADDEELLSGKTFLLTDGGAIGDGTAANLTDGADTTYAGWLISSYGAYVSLGETYQISKLEVTFRLDITGSRSNISFQIANEENGAYETIASIGSGNTEGTFSVDFTGGTLPEGSYFKIADALGTPNWVDIAEVKLYGSVSSSTPPADTPTNLLSGKTFKYVADDTTDTNLQLLTDGNDVTQYEWMISDKPVYVDLGAEYDITALGVVFKSNASADYRKNLSFRVSSDNTAYTTIAATGDGSAEALNEIFEDGSLPRGRYLKICVTDETPTWPGIAEVNLYGTLAPVTPPGPVVVTPVDVSTGKAVTSSGFGSAGYGPEKANDGSVGTMWECDFTNLSNIWWQVDLDSYVDITKVTVNADTSASNPGSRSNFEVLASNDVNFNSYVVIGSQDSTVFESGTVWTVDVDRAEKYRYVRLKKTAGEYFLLPEITILGYPEALTLKNVSYSQETLDLTQAITYSVTAANNSAETDTVSVLLVLSKDGVVVDLDYVTASVSPMTSNTPLTVTLPARAAGDGTEIVKAYVFDKFSNLYTVGSIQSEIK